MTKALTTISPKLYKEDLDPELDVEIDPGNLSKEFRFFSPLYYRYTMELAYVEQKVSDAKAALKDFRSKAYIRLKTDGQKRSEGFIEALVEQDELVKAQLKELSSLEYELRTFEGYVQALKFKKDFLIQLGADARKET